MKTPEQILQEKGFDYSHWLTNYNVDIISAMTDYASQFNQPLLNKKDLAVILNLLHFASDGWYVKETYDSDLFKSHTEQEKYVINLIKKINGSI